MAVAWHVPNTHPVGGSVQMCALAVVPAGCCTATPGDTGSGSDSRAAQRIDRPGAILLVPLLATAAA